MEAHRSAARSAKSNGRAAPIPLVYGEMAKYFRDGRDEPGSSIAAQVRGAVHARTL